MTANALEQSLVLLGRWLQDADYRFVTGTPASHARVLGRAAAQQAKDTRDVFGWSLPFGAGVLPEQVVGWLREGGLLQEEGSLARSRVRFSRLGEHVYAHSAYPTVQADAVFFGPDSYRFAALIESELRRAPLPAGARILDVGCGAGPGGLVAALANGTAAPELVLADINPVALQYAKANAALAGLDRATFIESDLYARVPGEFDLIVANPPYLVDAAARAYRHGGGPLGGGLSERIVAEGLPRLAPGGRLVLYTGAAIVDGHDPLCRALLPLAEGLGWPHRYWELDPDVFGEELEAPAYRQAERIAAVALVVTRTAG